MPGDPGPGSLRAGGSRRLMPPAPAVRSWLVAAGVGSGCRAVARPQPRAEPRWCARCTSNTRSPRSMVPIVSPLPGRGYRWCRRPPSGPNRRRGPPRCCKQHDARAGRALLRRRRPAGPGPRDRRLRLRLARDGALRPRPPGPDAGRRRRALHGRDGQDPDPGKARADARPRGDLLARPRLPGRRVRRLLRRASRPHRRGLCQHQRGGEGARRLDGDQLVRAARSSGTSRSTARRSCGRRTGTWAATSSARPAPTC